MSSSSDIEKLFDHFGGDANAYQEIGRENEAHSARTRWPLLVTLDLSQPQIPAIGQRRETRPRPVVEAPVAVDREDSTPKDAASVTRAKAPLFTRSHRRDIPPVAVVSSTAATATLSRGASRFGAIESKDAAAEHAATVAAVSPAATKAAAAPIAAAHAAVIPAVIPAAIPATISATIPAATQAATPAATPPAIPPAIPLITQMREPATSQHAGRAAQAPVPVAAHAQPQARPTAPTWTPAPPRANSAPPASAWPQATTFASAPARQSPPAQTTPSTSILGKLFAAQAGAAPSHAAEPATNDAPLQSVFDRLRGTPGQSSQTAAPATRHTWLNNGPRRS